MRSGPSRQDLQALSSRGCLRRPGPYGLCLSRAWRPCGRFVLACILFGARRVAATTRAIVSCAPNGATKRAGGFSGDRKSTPSELQSPVHLVCRLLLEKKKKPKKTTLIVKKKKKKMNKNKNSS